MADLFDWSKDDEAHLSLESDGTINIGVYSYYIDSYGSCDIPKEDVRHLYESLKALFEPDQAVTIAELERQLAEAKAEVVGLKTCLDMYRSNAGFKLGGVIE